VGLYRPVHVKTLRSQKLRLLLTHRKLLLSKAIDIENDLRGTLRNFGLKVGMVGTVKFEARIKELVENLPDLAVLVEPLLVVRRVLREQIKILHRRLLTIVRDDEVCRRLMTVPGVGPVQLIYRAKNYEGHSKDYEFSRGGMEEHWGAGYHATDVAASGGVAAAHQSRGCLHVRSCCRRTRVAQRGNNNVGSRIMHW
jgi:Patatin phospholipase